MNFEELEREIEEMEVDEDADDQSEEGSGEGEEDEEDEEDEGGDDEHEDHLRRLAEESEFQVGQTSGVGESADIDDVIEALGTDFQTGNLRHQLEHLKEGKDALDAPLPAYQSRLVNRVLQYEQTKEKNQKKWTAQMQRAHQSEQLVFGQPQEEDLKDRAGGSGKATLAKSFRPVNDFEAEIMEAIEAAGISEETVKGEDALSANPDIQAKIDKSKEAQLRALLVREQQRAKRVNKIKSKTFRKIQRKTESREREKLMETLEAENPELAEKLRKEFEKKRATMRLNRETAARRKWAQMAKRFGGKDMQRTVTEQAQKAHDEKKALDRLAKKRPGELDDMDGSSDEGEAGGSADLSSDEEMTDGTKGKDSSTKATLLLLDEIKQGKEELPEKGILSLPFMRRAIEKQRKDAEEQALEVIEDLQREKSDTKGVSDLSAEEVRRRNRRLLRGVDPTLGGLEEPEGGDEAMGGGEAGGDTEGVGKKQKKRKNRFTAEELERAAKELDDAGLDSRGFLSTSTSAAAPAASSSSSSSSAVPAGTGTGTGGEMEADSGAAAGAELGGHARAKRAKHQRDQEEAEQLERSKKGAEKPGKGGSPRLQARGKGKAKTLNQSGTRGKGPSQDQADDDAAAVASNPWLAYAQGIREGSAAVRAEGKESSSVQEKGRSVPSEGKEKGKGGKSGKIGESRDKAEAVDEETADFLDDIVLDEEGGGVAAAQRKLIRKTFAEGEEGDAVEEFEAELKEKERDEAEKKAAAEAGLPGWGSWHGTGVEEKDRGKRRGQKEGVQKDGVRKETTKHKPRVAVKFNHKFDPKVAKYYVPELPREAGSAELLEMQLRRPTGAEWNASAVHERFVQPKVNVRIGAVVPPLEHAKHLPKKEMDSLLQAWENSKGKRRTKTRL
uniref:Uncharacterized protein n=1 Tax=Chromera velia CCMP2878 TaxID=1169474 RepID=A0A0G4F255_9ALVE|eukprot:Cvel_14615.t1-p1 / transcript=Cvel_14615.t1 / gene=Cvel_14615 / organism=Chromera_velia_CCMP2878 / gene_product=Uncharacterized protein C57A7.06, putative / transcript_product=Uncharacterized protein C57A7.06, putative / location=Cvel_scaffold1045:24421-33330(+) / protein_length=897 / sequence_SO=supercontig / SO=protein_coding / is_pseudo=false